MEGEYRNRSIFPDRKNVEEQGKLEEAPFILEAADDGHREDVVSTSPQVLIARITANLEGLGDSKHRNQRAAKTGNHQ